MRYIFAFFQKLEPGFVQNISSSGPALTAAAWMHNKSVKYYFFTQKKVYTHTPSQQATPVAIGYTFFTFLGIIRSQFL